MCAAAVLFGVSEYAPNQPSDAHLRIEIVAILWAAVSTKYLAFAACVFPAMSDDSYGVIGVLSSTKERGRYACASPGAPSADLPAQAPALPSAPLGLTTRTCYALGAALHHVLVILSLGLYGRQIDGTYFSHASGYEVYYDELYEA